MTQSRLLASLIMGIWLLPAFGRDATGTAIPVGTAVIVVVGEFMPTRMPPNDSGYSKPLVVHPGKRGIVVGIDATHKDLVMVQWEEQYWQEWTEPADEDYSDSSRSFMSQTGKWIKWRRFTSPINIDNLIRPVASSHHRSR
jgi:hypothetical protein